MNKGQRWEYKVRDKYESLGYDVVRSAASLGKWDLIAIHKQLKLIVLIDCKNKKNLCKPERTQILNGLKSYEGQYTVIGVLEDARLKRQQQK